MCCTKRRPGRHAGGLITAGLEFGPQARDSKPRLLQQPERSQPPGRSPTCPPIQPCLGPQGSKLEVGKFPNSSCFAWATLDGGCLKAARVGRPVRMHLCPSCLREPLVPSCGQSRTRAWRPVCPVLHPDPAGLCRSVSCSRCSKSVPWVCVLRLVSLGKMCSLSLRRGKVPASCLLDGPCAPLFMGFSRQEYWSGWPCPPPGNLPDPGVEPGSLMSPSLAGEFFTNRATWEAPERC